jgi:hypothetical protein
LNTVLEEIILLSTLDNRLLWETFIKAKRLNLEHSFVQLIENELLQRGIEADSHKKATHAG